MDHPFGDDDKTFQLGESYQYYQPITISDHPSICPPPLLLPATTASHWPPPVEGGANPTGSSAPHRHLMMAKDPARRSRGADKRTGGGVKLSTDPQSVAARQRRHRISDRFKILKSLVPGGSKMDTVSMLEEAINYVKFLKAQIWLHQAALMLHPEDQFRPPPPSFPTPNAMPAAANACTNINVAGNYDYASSFTSACCLVLPNDHQHMCTMPPGDDQQPQATTNSVAFPCCTFHEEEEMFHQGSLNY